MPRPRSFNVRAWRPELAALAGRRHGRDFVEARRFRRQALPRWLQDLHGGDIGGMRVRRRMGRMGDMGGIEKKNEGLARGTKCY